MLREKSNQDPSISEFMRYLATHDESESQGLPPLKDLSSALGISTSGLREQLEVARALGLVEVKPRTGMRRLPYSFYQAVRRSLFYALTLNENFFSMFSDLRKHVESAYWHEAVRLLTPEDHQKLQSLMAHAWARLNGNPVQIPHEEHRQLHTTIFHRLDNPFVIGIIEAYWDAYEAVGLNVYTSYEYVRQVWEYHQKMVDAVCAGDIDAGHRALVEHTDLIYTRPTSPDA